MGQPLFANVLKAIMAACMLHFCTGADAVRPCLADSIWFPLVPVQGLFRFNSPALLSGWGLWTSTSLCMRFTSEKKCLELSPSKFGSCIILCGCATYRRFHACLDIQVFRRY